MHLNISSNINNILKRSEFEDHPIQDLLIYTDNIETDFDFIEFENVDYISFISRQKIEKLYNIEKKKDTWYRNMEHYMSYNPHSCWTMYRTNIKIGRFIKHIVSKNQLIFDKYKRRHFYYKNKNTDEVIETFVNSFKAIVKEFYSNHEERIEFITGEDIKHYYYEGNYNRGGTLNNSCMRYASCENYFDIYAKNPDKCKLMIYKDNPNSRKIDGRALIWQLEDGKTYMDRIYSTDEVTPIIFMNYARKNNWHYYDAFSTPYKDQDLIDKFYIKLSNIDFDYYPYMDTFKFLDYSSGELRSIDNYYDYELSSQYGNIDKDDDEDEDEDY